MSTLTIDPLSALIQAEKVRKESARKAESDARANYRAYITGEKTFTQDELGEILSALQKSPAQAADDKALLNRYRAIEAEYIPMSQIDETWTAKQQAAIARLENARINADKAIRDAKNDLRDMITGRDQATKLCNETKKALDAAAELVRDFI